MRPRGGIIGANITPTQTAASGIWTLREVEAYQRAGAWAALPGAPTSVSGNPGNAQVSLTWSAPAATGGYSITDYAVQYSSNSGSSWTTFSRSASATTSATVTGLTNGTGYVFRVAAVTVLGTGPYSTASGSVTPVSSKLTLTSSAGVTWSGVGTAGSPYTYSPSIPYAQFTQAAGASRLTFTATAGGTFYISATIDGSQSDSPSNVTVKKNGTGVADLLGFSGGNSQSKNFLVSAGDVITFEAGAYEPSTRNWSVYVS